LKPAEREWCNVGNGDTTGLIEDEAPGDLRKVGRGGFRIGMGYRLCLLRALNGTETSREAKDGGAASAVIF
jgi:hypothetical protein